MLGDVRRVSELAEITVHKLWERHGEDAGLRPWRRVLKRAMWEARDLAAGANRWQIDHTVPLGPGLARRRSRTDRTAAKKSINSNLLLDLVERRIEQDQRPEIRDVFKMLRQGYTWDEVAERLGDTNPEALKKRFWRWVKRNFLRKRFKSVPPSRGAFASD